MVSEETRRLVFAKSGGICEVCGGFLENPQLAHRVAKTKANIKKYGDAAISHPLNLAAVCSLKCNDACNIGRKTRLADALMAGIQEDLRRRRF